MTVIHPITGIRLNALELERVALDYDEAVTAHLMKMQGEKFSRIAHLLGANPARLGEVFRGEKHPGAASEAQSLLRKSSPDPKDV